VRCRVSHKPWPRSDTRAASPPLRTVPSDSGVGARCERGEGVIECVCVCVCVFVRERVVTHKFVFVRERGVTRKCVFVRKREVRHTNPGRALTLRSGGQGGFDTVQIRQRSRCMV